MSASLHTAAHGGGFATLCLTRLFVPPQDGLGGAILCADMSAENLCFLRAMFGDVPIRATPRAAVVAMLAARFDAHIADRSVNGLARDNPRLSARIVMQRGQVAAAITMLALVAFALAAAPRAAVAMTLQAMSYLFLATIVFRAVVAALGARAMPKTPELSREALPVYTILVPLYRERHVLRGLVRALLQLDYPRHLLDVKLVVEADDHPTLHAATRFAARAGFEIVAVPPSQPRTKPKACNYALSFARGEHLVIYDAEDQPEPQQLLKAVARFRHGPRDLACLQARLNFYNVRDNWLTRMFALDYMLWFDLMLPGLDRIGAPMPLGGTSNHFRTSVLRAIGAWDPFNVTEDADLGIRLSGMGFRVSVLDSITLEESPVSLRAWLVQRSRWLKGYMQTVLVHLRVPLRGLRVTHLAGIAAFLLFIGGAVVAALVNPLLWGLLAFSLARGGLSGGMPGGMDMSHVAFLVANTVLTGTMVAGTGRGKWGEYASYGLTILAYWALISAAGYRALWQLVVDPHHWDKTTHGVSRTSCAKSAPVEPQVGCP